VEPTIAAIAVRPAAWEAFIFEILALACGSSHTNAAESSVSHRALSRLLFERFVRASDVVGGCLDLTQSTAAGATPKVTSGGLDLRLEPGPAAFLVSKMCSDVVAWQPIDLPEIWFSTSTAPNRDVMDETDRSKLNHLDLTQEATVVWEGADRSFSKLSSAVRCVIEEVVSESNIPPGITIFQSPYLLEIEQIEYIYKSRLPIEKET
jgi:hypothetical protein